MVSAINFAVRNDAGGLRNGAVAGEGQGSVIQVGSGDSVSLNISRASVVGYEQQGRDLIVKLSDGRSITLAGYFDVAPGDVNHLYLSHDDTITQVFVQDNGGGVLFADYGAVEGYAKWSPLDNLKFVEADPISGLMVASNEPAGMGPLIPGLLGLGGLGGGAAAAAAVVGGAALIGGGGGGGSNGSGDDRPRPTVDPADTTTVTTNTENPELVVSGTGAPGDGVTVTIGDKSETTTIGEDGSWSVSFPDTNLPGDGEYEAEVTVTTPDGDIDLTGPDFVIDLTPPEVAITSGAQSTGDVENGTEYLDGVTITGTGEPGAKVEVVIAGQSQTTTVGSGGNWSVTFTTSQIATGEYETGMTVTSTDINGNKTVITDTLVVDTVANSITFDSVTADNTVNLTESNGALILTGTATPGAALTVTLAGVSRTVTADAGGSWTATWAAGTVTAGQYDGTVTATSTDWAGNVTNVSHAFKVDTLVDPFAKTGDSTGSDQILNGVEAADGLTVTGVVEPGSTVIVTFASGAARAATVDAAGNWTVTVPASEIPAGESTVTLTATATDAAGNTATLNGQITIDTLVTDFALTSGTIGGDGVLNAAEVAAGLALSGSVEPNSTVVVTLANGQSATTSATADGTWSVQFTAEQLPQGEATSGLTVTATDLAGNTATLTESFDVDTVTPDAPELSQIVRNAGAMTGIFADIDGEAISFHQVDAQGTASGIATTQVDMGDEDLYRFSSGVPDGSYLVIENADAAGNSASTLFVVNNTNTVTVDLDRAGLAEFDFSKIDLTLAPQASLTITEAQLKAITGEDQTLTIAGDSDDHVTLVGATATGTTEAGGQTYHVYTLGTGGSVLVDDDIQTTLV